MSRSRLLTKRLKWLLIKLSLTLKLVWHSVYALQKHPNVFNRVYISLVEASETSGTLDKGLERLADQQEKDADIISKVRGALIYPCIVLLVMVGVVGFMVVKVLPSSAKYLCESAGR